MRPEQLTREHAEWLADHIAAENDYTNEAACMLRQWPLAVPDMLAELERIAAYLRSPYFDEGMRHAVATGVEYAIAKAKGERK